ncbi:hypothetical protein FQA39_LY14455 [Lamprigera yunnana]|nr:hypothetical protein FQA39_LY14455 [Lamprigera yunnana]
MAEKRKPMDKKTEGRRIVKRRLLKIEHYDGGRERRSVVCQQRTRDDTRLDDVSERPLCRILPIQDKTYQAMKSFFKHSTTYNGFWEGVDLKYHLPHYCKLKERDNRAGIAGEPQPLLVSKGTSVMSPASKEVEALRNAGYLKLCRETEDEGAPVPGDSGEAKRTAPKRPNRDLNTIPPSLAKGAARKYARMLSEVRPAADDEGALVSEANGEAKTTPGEIAPLIMTHQNTTNSEYDNRRV